MYDAPIFRRSFWAEEQLEVLSPTLRRAATGWAHNESKQIPEQQPVGGHTRLTVLYDLSRSLRKCWVEDFSDMRQRTGQIVENRCKKLKW